MYIGFVPLSMREEKDFVNGYKIGGKNPFILIAGPCAIESWEILEKTAATLKELTLKHKIPWVFKSSYDKANRTSLDSYRGVGIEKGLELLYKIKEKFKVPILTDVHLPQEVEKVKEVVDILQIPAFLFRQTNLLVTSAKTKKWIHLKKGQFLSPQEAYYAVEKIYKSGNDKVILCERGSMFGYYDLVVDFRNLVFFKHYNIRLLITEDRNHRTCIDISFILK